MKIYLGTIIDPDGHWLNTIIATTLAEFNAVYLNKKCDNNKIQVYGKTCLYNDSITTKLNFPIKRHCCRMKYIRFDATFDEIKTFAKQYDIMIFTEEDFLHIPV